MDLKDDAVWERILAGLVESGKIYYFENDASIGGVPGHPHICIVKDDRVVVLSTISSQVETTRKDLIANGVATAEEMPVLLQSSTNKFQKSKQYVECDQAFLCEMTDFNDQISQHKIWDTDGVLSAEEMSLVIKGVLSSDKVVEEIKDMLR